MLKNIVSPFYLEEKIEILIKTIELFAYGIAIFERSGKLYYANTNYFHINNIAVSDIEHMSFDAINKCSCGFSKVLEQVKDNSTFTRQIECDGKWYESSFYLHDELIIQIFRDVTTQRKKELESEQMAFFFEHSNDGMMICDKKGTILRVNRAFEKITGYQNGEAIGKNAVILKSNMHDDEFFASIQKSVRENGSWVGELWNMGKNGESYPQLLSVTKIIDSRSSEAYYLSVFSDLSSIKELIYHANHDFLTGLANRVQLEAYMQNLITTSRSESSGFGVFYLDLDRFKPINDTYGHDVGDEILKMVAQRVRQNIRKEDFFARIGGDEFIVLIKDVQSREVLGSRARKIIDALRGSFIVGELQLSVGISIGIAIFPHDGGGADELIKHADSAMYFVKQNDRGSFRFYDEVVSCR
ncbi:MAG: diguanylate cyclase [Sulfuricurvum sp.]